MTRFDLEKEIRKTLTCLSETDVSHVPLDADLGDMIGLDSLGRLEMLSELEERFDITIYDIDSEKAGTIGGMIDIIETARLENAEAF